VPFLRKLSPKNARCRKSSRVKRAASFLAFVFAFTLSAPSANAAVNDLAAIANATAAANLLLNGATGITLTGTPTLIAANSATAMKQFTSIDQGAGRQIASTGIYLDSIGSSPGANNTVLRDKLVSVLSAGGYTTTVTQISALTFQVQADSVTTSVSMNYAFASRESCSADWDVAAVLVDNTNYAYLANGKVIRVNPASGNTAITPTSQFSGITCWSSVQTIVGILNKTANPPDASGISTHTITIAVADTGDTAVPSTFMVSMVRGGNETSGGVKTSPVNTAAPVLSVVSGGVARVGQTLSTTTGTWSNTPTSYEYTWASSADNLTFSTIAGATASTLAITDSLRGKYIRAAVSGRNASGLGVPANTLASTQIPQAIVLTKFSTNLSTNYGSAGIDTVTATNGSGTKTFTLVSSPLNAGITIDTSTSNIAKLLVSNNVNAGTYYETITATDIYSETATTLIIVTVQKIAQSPSLTFSLSLSTGKYSDSRTVTMTPTGGSGTGDITYSIVSGASGGTASGCSLENATANNFLRSTSIGTCVIVATKAADSNYLIETSTSRTFTITVADTLTVTSDTPTALTYTGDTAIFTPSVSSVSGLVTGDVISGATFSYSNIGGTSYGPSATKPANAGSYSITPSALTLSSGATSNYAAITYQTSTLTINKAAQATLTVVPLYEVFNGNPTSATLLTTGGSGSGTLSFAYVSSLSTAGACTLSGSGNSIITVTTEGTCRIVATKAASDNYLVAISDTSTVTFHPYYSYLPIARPQAYPTEIVLVGENTMSKGTNQAPVITSGTSSAASPGGTITLIGSGFLTTTSVAVCFTSATFTINSDTSLTINVPSGLSGFSGPILVENAYGTGFSDFLFTGL